VPSISAATSFGWTEDSAVNTVTQNNIDGAKANVLKGGTEKDDLSEQRTEEQTEFDPTGNKRTMPQHIEVCFFDGVKDGESTSLEQRDFPADQFRYGIDQWFAETESAPCVVDEELHHAMKIVGLRKLFAVDAEAGSNCTGNITATDRGIPCNVLPMVGKLQACTDRIGPLEFLFRRSVSKLENDASDRIGGIAAIIEQVVHRFIAAPRLIASKRDQ